MHTIIMMARGFVPVPVRYQLTAMLQQNQHLNSIYLVSAVLGAHSV